MLSNKELPNAGQCFPFCTKGGVILFVNQSLTMCDAAVTNTMSIFHFYNLLTLGTHSVPLSHFQKFISVSCHWSC